MYILRLKKVASKSHLTFWLVIDKYTKAPASGSFFFKIGFFKPILDTWANKYLFADVDLLTFLLRKGVKLNKSIFCIIKPLVIYALRHSYSNF